MFSHEHMHFYLSRVLKADIMWPAAQLGGSGSEECLLCVEDAPCPACWPPALLQGSGFEASAWNDNSIQPLAVSLHCYHKSNSTDVPSQLKRSLGLWGQQGFAASGGFRAYLPPWL